MRQYIARIQQCPLNYMSSQYIVSWILHISICTYVYMYICIYVSVSLRHYNIHILYTLYSNLLVLQESKVSVSLYYQANVRVRDKFLTYSSVLQVLLQD